ncbi:type II secretion system protein N (plasmid) [Marinovum sp. KMM 9989]
MKRMLVWLSLLLILSVSIAAGFVFYAPVAALSPRPASLLSPAGVTLSPEASLAQGGAVTTLRGAPLNLGWRLVGLSADPPGIGFDLATTGLVQGRADLIIAPASQTAQLKAGHFTAPVAAVLGLPEDRVDGQASVTLDSAAVRLRDRALMALQGQVVWQNAVIHLDAPIDLGDVHGRLTPAEDNRVRVVISNTGSETALSGSILIDIAQRNAELDLTVQPGKEAPQTLLAILDGWGARSGDLYTVQRTIALP